jgi:hypothetical protein
VEAPISVQNSGIKFLEKLTEVVGLYLNPPEKSLVLCIDEKSRNCLGLLKSSCRVSIPAGLMWKISLD